MAFYDLVLVSFSVKEDDLMDLLLLERRIVSNTYCFEICGRLIQNKGHAC